MADSILYQARLAAALPITEVAQAVGVARTTLYRIEACRVHPKPQTARALHTFYGGILTLGECYDPELTAEALDARRARRLRQLAGAWRATS